MDERIAHVAEEQGVDIGPLIEAEATSQGRREQIRERLEGVLDPAPEGVDVVVFGSLARGESTIESDCDYLVLIEALNDPQMPARFVVEMNRLIDELRLNPPGSQGVFGDFAISAELVSRIGLDVDTNTLTTRRLLLLIESASVYRPEVRRHTSDQMLRRYALDYELERSLPRFSGHLD